MSLVDTYLSTIAPGDERSVQAANAAAELSRLFGRRYRADRVQDWRTGRRPIPPAIRDYMLRRALFALHERGVVTDLEEAYCLLRDSRQYGDWGL